MMKRMLSLVLAVCLLLALAPAAHGLNGMNELKSVRILAWQEDFRLLDIYQDGDDLLMRAEDLSWLTDQPYTEYEDIFSFTRGSKTVKVDAKSNLIYLAGAQHGIYLANSCHKIDGTWYLPAASVLPWLNTRILVKDGTLQAMPNMFSLWDVVGEFDLADYYMALRYVIGMVANDYSDDLNKTIGMEMLLSFAELGNKYVIRYFKAVKSL